MGWAFCGKVNGREVGYGVSAWCDADGCHALIDRGLGYCCGSMHGGDNGDGCGGYYCGEHTYEHACPENYGDATCPPLVIISEKPA